MAATTRTALKAFIESLGLGLNCFQDVAPENQLRPYVVILGPLSVTPDRLEDGGTLLAQAQAGATRPTGSYQTATELLQVDLWQTWRNPAATANDPQHVAQAADHALLEDYTLPEKLFWAIHGARLPSAPQVVYACILRGYPRLFERKQNLVHHPGTIEVKRQATG